MDIPSELNLTPLTCPCCRGENLHQQAASWFHNGSRADILARGAAVVPPRPDAAEDTLLGHRAIDSLLLTFLCEVCGQHNVLRIYQAKGHTHIDWLSAQHAHWFLIR